MDRDHQEQTVPSSSAIKLYGHPMSPYSARVKVLLDFAQVPYDFIPVDLGRGEHLLNEFRRLSPFGKVPVMVHEGFALAESLVINRYLCDIYHLDDIYPSESDHMARQTRARIDQLSDYFSAHIGKFLLDPAWTNSLAPQLDLSGNPEEASVATKKIARPLREINFWLSDKRFLMGESFLLCDINAAPFLDLVDKSGLDFSEFTHVQNWANRVRERLANARGITAKKN